MMTPVYILHFSNKDYIEMKLYVVITADTMFIERIVCHCILKTGCVHFSVS